MSQASVNVGKRGNDLTSPTETGLFFQHRSWVFDSLAQEFLFETGLKQQNTKGICFLCALDQMNRRILVQSRFISSFDLA